MFNFGVQEVANTRSISAPGWAYVPDVGANSSATALQPSSRKRPRTQLGPSNHDTTAKQDAKLARDLASLDRENHRDVTIPVPVRHRDNAGRASHGKVTPAVRKILQSAKTFANHLADYQALLEHPSSNPAPPRPAASTPVVPVARGSTGTSTPSITSKGTRSHKKKDTNSVSTPTPLRKVSSAAKTSTPVKSEPQAADIPIPDVTILTMASSTVPTPHPEDSNQLLVSRIPSMPTQAEIEKLLAAPPLSYIEARGPWVDEDQRKPVRRFCEICGYWGRVKCKTCGGRVCALECLNVHQEECFTKYGA